MVYKDIIRKFTLQNAIRYNGKANPGNIIGKVLGENPDFRTKAKEIQKEILETVKEVNSMSLEEQKAELEKTAPEMLEKKEGEKKTDLKDLENAEDGNVVLRIEPSPSGPLHIGHAYVAGLNHLYAKKYNGRFIVRISDTNPDSTELDCFELIPEDANWLTNKGVSDVFIQSDRMQLYYDFALQLIDEGNAYICTCEQEEFRNMINKSIPCPCRELNPDEHAKRWHNMFTDFKEGDAVMRIKTDIKHKNPAMRDFPAMRINENEHPRTGNKYRVWPLMNFAVAIDDMDMGITHALRGKDHADNAKRQECIHNYLDHNTPIPISVGRINFEGFPVSCTKTRPLIEDGTYTGWDDIRLPFLSALKRRGIQPEALLKYCIEVGVTRNDKSVQIDEFFKTIHAFNKELIDDKSNRYFFVDNPVKIKVEGAEEQDVTLDLHPDHRKGGRALKTTDTFYITREDYDNIQDGEEFRLRDCLNAKKENNKFILTSVEHKDFKGKKIIHWLPEDNIEIEVLMHDNTLTKGIGEEALKDLNEGEIVQFERFGFVIKDKESKFYFTHK